MTEIQSESCPIASDELPPPVAQAAGPNASAKAKMMTARGFVPGMAAADVVLAQFVLRWDADARISEAAHAALENLPPPVANAVLSDPKIHPEVLGFLAKTHAGQEAYIEKILLNPSLPAPAVIEVAKVCSERIVSNLIVNNQARLLEAPEISLSLLENPAVLKSDVDRAIDFLVRSGQILDHPQFEEALMRLGADDRKKAADQVDLKAHQDMLAPEHRSDREDERDEEKKRERQYITEEEEAREEAELTIEQRLRTMSVAEKVALGTKGNKSVRNILLRDTNRLVAVAAISSPAITEQEIIAAANNKSVHQDVIGHIVRDRKNNWVRNYQVKLGLVNNPKTPVTDATKFLPFLNPRDLKSVAKSRNVPGPVRNAAAQLDKNKRR